MVVRRQVAQVVGVAGLMLLLILPSAIAATRFVTLSSPTPLATCNQLSAATALSEPVTIQLQCRSVLGGALLGKLAYVIVSGPEHGTLSLTATTGQAIYTPSPGYSGPDSFSYSATNRLGTAAAATVSITVGAASVSTPLTVANAAQSHSTWREGNRLATFSRKKRPPLGTTFSFTLNQPARVSFAFTQQVGGRRVKGRCLAQTKHNRNKRSCKRTVTRGTLSFTGHSGVNEVAFQGRVSPSRKLGLGRYTLLISATNPVAQRSHPKSLNFTIVK